MDVIERKDVIELDGKENGFAVYFDKTKKYLLNKDKNIRLFKNLDIMKSWLANKYHIYNPIDYKIKIVLGGRKFDFDSVEKVFDIYEYATENNITYFVPRKINKVVHLGYIVSEDGDTKKCNNRKTGSEKSKELYRICHEFFDAMIRYPYMIPGIDQIYVNEMGHLTAKVKNCTGEIHVIYNSQLMNLNMARKEQNIGCVPYIKEMDKYLTMYLYTTKDNTEPDFFDVDEKMKIIIDLLTEYIDRNYPHLGIKYVPVEYKKFVRI